jgi:putative DNA primase/helicase
VEHLLTPLDIPEPMLALPHWGRSETVGGRVTKVPYSISGDKARSNDPRTWSTFEEVSRRAHRYSGMGFQLGVEPCGIVAVDLDKCKDIPLGAALSELLGGQI